MPLTTITICVGARLVRPFFRLFRAGQICYISLMTLERMAMVRELERVLDLLGRRL